MKNLLIQHPASPLFEQPLDTPERPKRIAVIGAGLAGLACADRLVAAGHQVAVFEGRQRVGGRVLSFRPSPKDGVVEAGGEFIGRNHRAWQSYAKEFNLSLMAAEPHASTHWLRGTELLPTASFNAAKRFVDQQQATLTFLAESIDSATPWHGANAVHWDALSAEQWIKNLDLHNTSFENMLKAEFEGLNGLPLKNQSMLGHLSQIHGGGLENYWTDSQTHRCLGGNEQLASALKKRVGEQHIHFNQAVTQVYPQDATKRCSLLFDSGARWSGDAVVVTAPPPSWHKNFFADKQPLRVRPQLSETTKHITYLTASSRTHQMSNVYLHDNQLACEMWSVSPPDRQPYALVTFVPIRQRLTEALALTSVNDVMSQMGASRQSDCSTASFRWWNEPFTRGGYAFPAPQEITSVGERLYREQDGILFAGDWAQYSHSGYMEGALLAGQRAANLLLVA